MSETILEFIGNTDGAQVFRHPLTSRSIRAGRNLAVRYVTVSPEEVPYLMSLGLFRVAHAGNMSPTVTRTDAPKRIEPIFQQPAEESKPAIAVSEPAETIVAFDDTELDSSLTWMNESAPTAEVVEDVETEDVAPPATSTVEKIKINRGRPKN